MMPTNLEDFNNAYRKQEELELNRAKTIRNNHFVQVQAYKFNYFNNVLHFLTSNFWEIEPSSNEYPFVKNNKYINLRDRNSFIFVFFDNNDVIFYIDGLRDGTPRTAFDCLVAIKFKGDDYAAALDTYQQSYKTPDYSPPPAAFYPIYPNFKPSAFGISDWMKFEEYLKNDLFSDAGIPLCFVECDRDNYLYRLYYQDERHLITIAPNGTGKGTCAQIPVLLLYDAAMLVIDPKGENAAVTAKYRKKGMKHDVFILNPFNVLHEHFASEGFNSKETGQFESACFNPLAALNPEDDNFVSDVASLSEALVDIVDKDPFWSDSARELVNCLILFICTSDDYKYKKNLIQMRRLLTQNTTEFTTLMETIAKLNFAPMAQKARRFINDNRTNQAIISTAITQTSFLDDPTLAKNLVSNDIDFLKLKEGKMTVYVILPAKLILIYSKWFKLVVTSALNALMSTNKQSDKKVLVMLDECPILGRLTCIETAVGLARGFGIQLWTFWQDIHQLYDVYKERAESFLANAGVQQYFTPNDMVLAEKLSKRLGNTTTFSGNVNYSSISFSETAVPFLKPVELFGLPEDRQLLFLAGKERAVLGIKYPYHFDKYCKDKASKNPYFKE